MFKKAKMLALFCALFSTMAAECGNRKKADINGLYSVDGTMCTVTGNRAHGFMCNGKAVYKTSKKGQPLSFSKTKPANEKAGKKQSRKGKNARNVRALLAKK